MKCGNLKCVLISIIVFTITIFGLVFLAYGNEKVYSEYVGKVHKFGQYSDPLFVTKLCIDGYTYIVVHSRNGISTVQAMFSGVDGYPIPFRCKPITNEEDSNYEESAD